eukprot:jgi/Psemu1/6921/gm1.6921_g
MPNEDPPGDPIARRTHSNLSLGDISRYEVANTPREGFLSLQPQSSARRSLFQDNSNNMPTPNDPGAETAQPDPFPSFDTPMKTQEIRDILCKALIKARIVKWSRFVYLSPQDIADLVYKDWNQRLSLTQRDLKAFLDFGIHLEDEGENWEDNSKYTKEAFDAYQRPIGRARRRASPNNILTPGPTPTIEDLLFLLVLSIWVPALIPSVALASSFGSIGGSIGADAK